MTKEINKKRMASLSVFVFGILMVMYYIVIKQAEFEFALTFYLRLKDEFEQLQQHDQ